MSTWGTRLRTGVAAMSFVLLLAACAAAQKASAPKSPDILAIGQPHVTQLLLLMETGNTGTISKEEWMKFMAAEFDRMDKAKVGELNVKDLKASEARAIKFGAVGK